MTDTGALAGLQWSPPVIGGVTMAVIFLFRREITPQWSPPVIGGVT